MDCLTRIRSNLTKKSFLTKIINKQFITLIHIDTYLMEMMIREWMRYDMENALHNWIFNEFIKSLWMNEKQMNVFLAPVHYVWRMNWSMWDHPAQYNLWWILPSQWAIHHTHSPINIHYFNTTYEFVLLGLKNQAGPPPLTRIYFNSE